MSPSHGFRKKGAAPAGFWQPGSAPDGVHLTTEPVPEIWTVR